jgi:imidazolonepropionase-like amidohydrolase
VLAENETWQIPTLALITRSANRPYARDTWRDQFRFLPDSVGQSWEQRAAEAASEPVDPDAERFRDWVMGMVAELKRAGVDMMAGTDTPIGLLTPGFSLHEELALLVRGGLTPLEAIASATLRPAQYFELDDELGRIDRGMRADLVLLEANPLDDIRNTRSIRAVMKDGRLHGQAALDRIRRQLENAE